MYLLARDVTRRIALALIVLVACAERRTEPTPAPAPAPTPTPTPASTPPPPIASPSASLPPDHWCTEGLDALDDDTCYVIPAQPASPRAIVIYLHGVVDPGGRTQRIYQQIVAARARARGFIAFMPRGRRGIAPKNIKDWWAWPTSADAYVRYAKELTQSWLEKKRRLEAIVGGSFDRTYLAGSSNGAYFVAILALKGEFVADGFGAMSGGNAAGRSKETIAATSRPAFYVGWGAQDDTHDDPKSLAALLVRAGWPSKSAEHPVGHGAREVYLDEAFDFWTNH